MARRAWVERDHPRHPGGSDRGGRFRDRVGSSGWAARLASAIGKGSSREVRSLDDEDMRPPWEGGPEDEDDHFLREWQGRLNAIIRERGVEPEVVLPADADELNSYYGQYQADPAELVDYLWEQQMLPGGRGDLDDLTVDQIRAPLREELLRRAVAAEETHGPQDSSRLAEAGFVYDEDEQAWVRRQPRGRLTNQEVAQALSPAASRFLGDTTHDEYNEGILQEAIAAREMNGDDLDEELDAQIELVQELRRRGKFDQWSNAIDHLRRMLTISYLDEDELPPLPPGRRSGTTGV